MSAREFAAETPPSTSMSLDIPREVISFLRADILSREPSMNCCPPKPAKTDIIRKKSASSMYGKRLSTGMSGLIANPAWQPQSLTMARISEGFLPSRSAASRWKLIRPAPALANLSTYLSGLMIMRWASIGFSAMRATASNTGKPNEMFGTSVPSITSKWMMSAWSLTRRMSFSRCRKSAERMEGASSLILLEIHGDILEEILLKLKPGLTANVNIYTLEMPGVLAIPSKALRFKPNEAMLNEGETITDVESPMKVWTKEGPNLKAIAIQTGVTNGTLTQVTNGLTAGTKVIIDVQSNELEEEAQQQSNPFMPKPRNRNNEKDKKKQ